MFSLSEQKNELRKQYKKLRSELVDTDLLSFKIASQLKNINLNNKTIHLFLPILKQTEVNTFLIKTELEKAFTGIVWATGVSNFETGTMQHVLLEADTQLTENSFGIPEPENGKPISEKNIDIVFVPLLTTDIFGNRLGYGKGFYDRFLANCNPNCKFIGLNFFEPTDIPIPADVWDIKLHSLATPINIYRF